MSESVAVLVAVHEACPALQHTIRSAYDSLRAGQGADIQRPIGEQVGTERNRAQYMGSYRIARSHAHVSHCAPRAPPPA